MMNTKTKSKKLSGIGMFALIFSLFMCSCSLGETVDPFAGPEGCVPTTPGGFFEITIDEDGVLWSSGMKVSEQPAEWACEATNEAIGMVTD